MTLQKKLILGSKSPRRRELLKGLDIPFEVLTQDIDEVYPEDLDQSKIPGYLSKLKATAFEKEIENGAIILTSDTIVLQDGKILTKPENRSHATQMLHQLSGKKHEVITGVCLKTKAFEEVFSDQTTVYFKQLKSEEINYYLEKYKPYDKAGSYGIQEWIGYIGIKRIEGCFFNVMGLPVRLIYEKLLERKLLI